MAASVVTEESLNALYKEYANKYKPLVTALMATFGGHASIYPPRRGDPEYGESKIRIVMNPMSGQSYYAYYDPETDEFQRGESKIPEATADRIEVFIREKIKTIKGGRRRRHRKSRKHLSRRRRRSTRK